MPPSVRAHLATQPDSASLESLAMLADRAVAAEKDVDEAKQGVAEIQVSESGKLVGLLENLSRRLKKLETATAKATLKKTYGRSQETENRATKTQPNRLYLITKMLLDKMFPRIIKKDSRPNAPPPHLQHNNAVQPTDTVNAQVCYYHQTFSEKVRLCSEPCSYYKTIGQREVVNIVSYPAKLLYVDDKRNKCKYLIDMGAAVSVLPKSCSNRTIDAASFPLITLLSIPIQYTCRRRWSQTRLRLDIHSSGHQTTNYRSRFSHTLHLTGSLKKSLSERHANRFSYTSYFIVY